MTGDRSLMDKTMASDAVVAGSSPVGRTCATLIYMTNRPYEEFMKHKIKKIWGKVLANGKYAFPVIVCVAVAITVVIALTKGGFRKGDVDQIGEQPAVTADPLAIQSQNGEDEEVALEKNEDPAIDGVITTYYNALAEGNEAALNTVCDKVEEMDMLWFMETAKYVEYYPMLEIYTKPGFAEGETIAYVCFKVKLTGKDADYPGYTVHYVCTADDGTLYIKRTSLSNEANEYLLRVSGQADVLEMTNRVKVEFNNLMTEQPDLLAYMNEVSADVKKMVGLELSSQKVDVEPNQTGENDGSDGNGEDGQTGDPGPDQNVDNQEEEVIYAVATTTVNVRKSDSEKAEKLGRVASGTKIQVLEQLVNGWSKVVFEKQEGYIMSKYLKVQEAATKYVPIGKVRATDNINVRTDASTDSGKIGTLVKGEEVDLLAIEGDWCKINYKGQIAYVKAEYVEQV